VPDAGFALGVLWHPEQDNGSRLMTALVAAAAQRQPA
jgi:gamma-glutamyl-gamma-aminobutyrate hydrolase PuuD